MNPSYYIPLLFLLLIVYITIRNKKTIITRKIIKKRKPEDPTKMNEIAKQFIGKECIIYAFDSGHQFEGVIKEVQNGAILIEKNQQLEAINLDFVIRIREYPKSKKGKKKSVILD